MKDQTYKVKYKIDFGEFTKEQLAKADSGGCDEFGLISVIGGVLNGEQMSVALLSWTPSGEWNADQWFEIWSLMAHNILKESDLSPERRQIAQEAFDKIRAMKMRGRS